MMEILKVVPLTEAQIAHYEELRFKSMEAKEVYKKANEKVQTYLRGFRDTEDLCGPDVNIVVQDHCLVFTRR